MIHKLPTDFAGRGSTKGYTFRQVFDGENGYVYEVNTGDSVHFEAFRKKKVAVCIDFDSRWYSERS
jgi:hypothetical protein